MPEPKKVIKEGFEPIQLFPTPSERHCYIGALKGTHVTEGPGLSCRKSDLWLFAGDGYTAGRDLAQSDESRFGKEIISLNSLLCTNIQESFASQHPGAVAPSLEYVFIGQPYFTALPIDSRPVILTTTTKVVPIPIKSGPYFISDWEGATITVEGGSLSEHKDITITVKSYLDGKLAGPVAFNWQCVVEIGIEAFSGG